MNTKSVSVFLSFAAAISLWHGPAWSDSGEAGVAERLKTLYPTTRFGSVRPAEVEGLFEVSMGRSIAFTDTSARYFVFGHLFDMKTQTDLTAERLATINRIDFSGLPIADAIVTVRGGGRRRFAVFSDPDCPYCKELERELAKLDDVTIYTFLYPIDALHPEARLKAQKILCARDRAKAWSEFMARGAVPDSPECATKIDQLIDLASGLGINATPTLVFPDGALTPGVVPAKEIERRLAGGQQNMAAGVVRRTREE